MQSGPSNFIFFYTLYYILYANTCRVQHMQSGPSTWHNRYSGGSSARPRSRHSFPLQKYKNTNIKPLKLELDESHDFVFGAILMKSVGTVEVVN